MSKNKKIFAKEDPTDGSSYACLSRANNQCCKQVVSTKRFKSQVTNESFQIRHKLNCRSRNVIYLGFYNLCPKTQYLGKSEPPVNLSINTHRHEVKSPNGGQFDKHFNLSGHDYNENARFILIEQVNQQSKMKKKTIRQLLENREDHWVLKLKNSNTRQTKRPPKLKSQQPNPCNLQLINRTTTSFASANRNEASYLT